MPKATIQSGIDAFVLQGAPNGRYPRSNRMKASNAGSAAEYTYLYFKNPAPRKAVIISATLHLVEVGNFGGSKTITVQRANAKWSESDLSYNNRPAVTGATASVTATGSADGQDWAIDITALVQTMTDSGVNFGLRLSTTSTTELNFGSFNNSDHNPKIVVHWAVVPDAPVDLSPAGGASVTQSKPTLMFNYHDPSGDSNMASLQVQINPTNSFGSPAFDSGEVGSTTPELDLSTTAYAGLSVGSSAWWRVRVKNDSGGALWSDWSDPTTWNRVTRGSLVINSPANGAALTDGTQDIIFTLTGAAMTGWRLIIVNDANPTKYLLDTGKRYASLPSGTNFSYKTPKGVFTREDTTYRVIVRVWDDLRRVANPNDLVFTEAVSVVTFASGGTADPITSFAFAGRANRQPGIVLTWSRSTAPDKYEIRRGDSAGTLEVIDTDLDPVDLLTSGTNYKYIDKTAAPRRNYTYRVVCKISTGNKFGPTLANAQYTVQCLWLEDWDGNTGKIVPILYRDGASDGPGDMDQPTIGAVLQTIAGGYVTRTEQGRAGLQGSVAGVIVGGYGDIAKTWRDNFIWMTDRSPDNKLRLTIGNRNLKVSIGDVVIAPYVGGGTEMGDADRIVKFNWWEQP